MKRTFWWIAVAGGICLIAGQVVMAQDRGNRGDRSSDRGDRGDREERRFDPTEILKRMDQNGNGQLEPNEISDRGRRFVGEIASKAGLDPNGPLAIDKLIAAANGDDASSPMKPATTPATGATNKNEPPPRVPGFGLASTGQVPPGFDVPLDKAGGRFQRPLEERFEKAVLDRVDDMLRQYDDNKDGKLDYVGEENKDIRWQNEPKTSDLNNDGKLDREELCKRIAKIMGSRERTENENSRGGGGGSSSSGDDAQESRAKVRRYAEGLLKQHDENKNGVLEKDEWNKMRGEPGKADLDRDGVLTLDELTEHVGNFGKDSSSSSSSTSSSESSRSWGSRSSDSKSGSSSWGSRSRSESSSRESTDRKHNRLLTPTERLPKGLPTWFARNDADADGQVTMAEYSTSWNETTVIEFNRFDKNSDGVITPEECLIGEKEKVVKK